MVKSKDLQDEYFSIENPANWLKCPHCGCEDVELDNFGGFTDLRTTVDCQNCEADGFFD